MNRLKSLLDKMPFLKDVRTVLAVVVIVVSLALLIVISIPLLRALPPYRQILSDLALSQEALDLALQMQKESPAQIKTQIAVAEATLEEAVSVFPNDEQGTEQLELSNVQRYALDAGVRISNLEDLVNTPEEESETIYTTRRVLLEATGELLQLTAFVSLLTQSALPTFDLDNLKILPVGESHTLTANVILYSSSLSAGVTPPPTPEGPATPVSETEIGDQLNQAWTAGDWPKAISLLLEITELHPEDENAREMLYMAYVNNGYALLDQGKRDEAIIQFNHARSIDPDGEEASQGLTEALETSLIRYAWVS